MVVSIKGWFLCQDGEDQFVFIVVLLPEDVERVIEVSSHNDLVLGRR